MVELDPTSGYICDLHGKDLTEAVRRKLEPVREVVGLGPRISRRRRRNQTVDHEPFTVLAPCPGDDSQSEHKCEFSGHFSIRG
jgi:hypothetical protein